MLFKFYQAEIIKKKIIIPVTSVSIIKHIYIWKISN